MAMHGRSSAWPLSALFAGMVVYASLYPFEGWRTQGLAPWSFVTAPWPQYWTGFDVGANLFGYAPLGFLLALAMLRSHWRRSFVWACLLSSALSFGLESLQNYLPRRVPSNLDWALNSLGAVLGAGLAVALERLGLMRRWNQFRDDWFEPTTHGALVLLALWPLALMYPPSVPFGLGQVAERSLLAIAAWMAATPWADLVPSTEVLNLLPLSPGWESVCIGLGALAPLLLGYAEIRDARKRWVFWCVWLAMVALVPALSTALTWSPARAWAWLSVPVWWGLAWAALAGLLFLGLPRRWCSAVLVASVLTSVYLLNAAAVSPYFDQSLGAWEQGQFIHFHGVTQWLGWVWPFVALWMGVRGVWRRPALRW
jgi:VanZ family protein